jgi:molybdopterin converting factor small subunit
MKNWNNFNRLGGLDSWLVDGDEAAIISLMAGG